MCLKYTGFRCKRDIIYTLVGFKFVLASDPIYKLVRVLRARGIKCAFCGRSISTLGLDTKLYLIVGNLSVAVETRNVTLRTKNTTVDNCLVYFDRLDHLKTYFEKF